MVLVVNIFPTTIGSPLFPVHFAGLPKSYKDFSNEYERLFPHNCFISTSQDVCHLSIMQISGNNEKGLPSFSFILTPYNLRHLLIMQI